MLLVTHRSISPDFFDLEQTHKLYEQKYLSNHSKMIENARQIQDVERILQLGVKAAIEDLK
jgi:hypothetical protein